MRALWFRRVDVAPILSGAKTQTIRRQARYAPGDRVPCTVGPRQPFATVHILTVEPITLEGIPPEGRRQYEEWAPGCTVFYRHTFALV